MNWSTAPELRAQVMRLWFETPAQAMSAGVVLVPQELRVVPQLSVAENILLGQLPVRRLAGILPALDHMALRERAARILEQAGIELEPDGKTGELDFASRQLVVIARALSRQARLLMRNHRLRPPRCSCCAITARCC